MPVLFLTGATGLVGRELLKLFLASRPELRVVVLCRRTADMASLALEPRITALQGDVTQPLLGLDRHSVSLLQSSLTEVIHCAADTRFGLPLEAARAVNVRGTQHVIALARACPRLEKFAQLSTVYVAGLRPGFFQERPLSSPQDFCNTYQQSKYEAERLVVEAMGQLPAMMFRLSSILGDSSTGRVDQFNHLHRLLRLVPRNVLPILPADPSAPVDLIPLDWAIPAVAALFQRSFLPGGIYQVCAGKDESLTVRQMIDLTVELFACHPLGTRLGPIRVPDLVSLSEYDEYVKRQMRGKDLLLKEILRALGCFLPHLGVFQAFDNRHVRESLSANGPMLPSMRDCYTKVVRYCLETNWGRGSPPGPSAISCPGSHAASNNAEGDKPPKS